MMVFISPVRMLFWGLVFAGGGGFMAYHNWQQDYASITIVVPGSFACLGVLVLAQSLRIIESVLRTVFR
jgi:hypothetical protein